MSKSYKRTKVAAAVLSSAMVTSAIMPASVVFAEESQPVQTQEVQGFRYIRVEYVNAAGGTVERRQVRVNDGQLSIVVNAPEGYTLFDTNNVISVNDSTKSIKVPIVRATNPGTPTVRYVSVEYVDMDGNTVDTQQVQVNDGQLLIVANAPEGYTLFDTNNVISINDSTSSVKVQVIKNAPAVRFISVEYVDMDGNTVDTQQIQVNNGQLSLVVNAPEGYNLFDTNNVISIDDLTTNVKVQVVKNAPALRFISVEYVDMDGNTVDTQQVQVNNGQLSLVVNAPEGYNLFDTNNVISIDDLTTNVKVQVVKKEVKPEFRYVRVNYKNPAGETVATDRVKVELGRLTMTVKAPEGYDLVDTNNVLSIDDSTKSVNVAVIKKVVKPEVPAFRYVRVNYKNAAGATVATDRVKVELGRLTMTVKAPEGYDLVDTNNVLSIDDSTKSVNVAVIKKVVKPETPDFRYVRVNYKDAAGTTVAAERVKVELGRLTMTVKAPEGYDLVDTNNVISIDDSTKEIDVLVTKHIVDLEGTRTVTVKLMCGTEQLGKDLQVEVPAASKYVEKADLEKLFAQKDTLPSGYKLKTLSDAYYIEDNEIYVAVVKEFTDLEPAKPIIPLTPLQPAKPVTPIQPITPAKPARPVKPVQPAKPAKPSKVPTSVATNLFGTISTMGASLAAALGLIASKKRK